MVDSTRGDFSIEIDPRTIDSDKLGLLKGLGFTRLSFGIQDFDAKVQQSINRIQPISLIADLMKTARAYHYKSINFDLIYGLPYQTVDSVNDTIENVLTLNPDRISLFNYAHLPQRFKSQGLLDEEALPLADERLQILCSASSLLVKSGYIYVGMDHFAKPDDELAIALAKGTLHRNFQGYSTHKEADLIGMGISSISQIDNVYCQNAKSIRTYDTELGKGRSPISTGVILSQDDEIRRAVIMSIICSNRLDYDAISSMFAIDFYEYFAKEILILREYANQGLLKTIASGFVITKQGKLVIRKVCMVFDSYLSQHKKTKGHFSRII